jgi:hypothetical protein
MFGPFFSPGYFARSYFAGTGESSSISATLSGVGELVATALGFGPSDRYAALGGVGNLVASITGSAPGGLNVWVWDGAAWQARVMLIWNGASWT